MLSGINQVYSQSYNYKHYTVEDGLPSSEVYSAFQDSKGYMWFATDAGVSRFNGYEFENFDVSDGLTDNTVFLITEDRKGRIWFGTFNCQLSYFKNDSIYPYEHNNKLIKVLTEKKGLWSFYVDNAENIWIGFLSQGIFRCDVKGEIHQMMKLPKGIGLGIKLFQMEDSFIYGTKNSFEFEKKTRKHKKFNYKLWSEFQFKEKKMTAFLDAIYLDKKGVSNWVINYYKSGVIIIYGSDVLIYYDKNDTIEINKLNVPFLEKNRFFSTVIDGDFIWFCIENEGVYKCKIINDELEIVDRFLYGKSISRIFKDKENGVWFQSLKEGVYYLSSEEIKYKKRKGIPVSLIEIDTKTGQLYTSQENGDISRVLRDKNDLQYKSIAKVKNRPTTIKYYYNQNSLLIGEEKSSNFTYYQNGQIKYWRGIRSIVSKSILVDEDTIYRVGTHGVSILINGIEKYSSRYSNRKLKIWCTSLIKNKDKLWIGTNDGIRIYYNKNITDPFANNKYLSSSITSMERLNKDVFLIGTKSYGILVIKNDSIVDVINEKDGLVRNLVRKIHIDNQKTIWVGTNKGLSRIDYAGTNNQQIYNLTQKHGLISEEINGISSYKDIIYVVTPEGLIHFDKTKIRENTTLPPTYITAFSINEKGRKLEEKYQFSYKENNINITYEGLNYRSLGEIEYQYRMLGIDTTWVSTVARNVRYPSLRSQDYTFEVKSKNEDGYWGKPAILHFTINPPIWLTWWFITLTIVLGILIIYLIFKYQIRQYNFKNEMNRKILVSEKIIIEEELTALRAQMNPHFIFNTLGAIQNAIISLDKRVAYDYVESFGRLIRIVLESSKNPDIELDMEIEMISLYIDLESVRFSNKFSFNITIDEHLEQDIFYVPTMVIQPFVENAILHGLVPKVGESLLLSINFTIKGDTEIICTIEDNGIGRLASEKLNRLKKLDKKSMGMKITKERLDLYYKGTGKRFSFNIIDLIDENDNPLGTKVEIIFPI